MKRTILIGSFFFWELCIALTAAAQDGGVGSVKQAPLPVGSIGIGVGGKIYSKFNYFLHAYKATARGPRQSFGTFGPRSLKIKC